MSEPTKRLPEREKNLPPGEPADHALGRTRGGWGSKIHLVCDGRGLPLATVLTGGQKQECKHFYQALDAIRIPRRFGRPRQRPAALAADKGYSYRHVRKWLRQHGIRAVIPQRIDQLRTHRGRPLRFNREEYRRRNIIERLVGWLKERRRIATRFEKLALHFGAMLKLALLQLYLNRYLANTP